MSDTPTAGAMRAGKAIELHTYKHGVIGPATSAKIIDRETGLPELLAACKLLQAHVLTSSPGLTLAEVRRRVHVGSLSTILRQKYVAILAGFNAIAKHEGKS